MRSTTTGLIDAIRRRVFPSARPWQETADRIPGWMSLSDLEIIAEAAARVPERGTIVEVGPFLGRTTYALSKVAAKQVKVYVVDCWDWLPDNYGADMPGGPIDPKNDAEVLFRRNIAGCNNVITVKGWSPEAHPPVPTGGFDFVFIDGDHQSPGFDRDVEFYFSALKPGGILMGDDYSPDHWPNIVEFLRVFSQKVGWTVYPRGDKLWLMAPS